MAEELARRAQEAYRSFLRWHLMYIRTRWPLALYWREVWRARYYDYRLAVDERVLEAVRAEVEAAEAVRARMRALPLRLRLRLSELRRPLYRVRARARAAVRALEGMLEEARRRAWRLPEELARETGLTYLYEYVDAVLARARRLLAACDDLRWRMTRLIEPIQLVEVQPLEFEFGRDVGRPGRVTSRIRIAQLSLEVDLKAMSEEDRVRWLTEYVDQLREALWTVISSKRQDTMLPRVPANLMEGAEIDVVSREDVRGLAEECAALIIWSYEFRLNRRPTIFVDLENHRFYTPDYDWREFSAPECCTQANVVAKLMARATEMTARFPGRWPRVEEARARVARPGYPPHMVHPAVRRHLELLGLWPWG